MLQGMTELNIQAHGGSGSGSVVSLEDLERFWDSEAPRIGDAHPSAAGVLQWLRRERESAAAARKQVMTM